MQNCCIKWEEVKITPTQLKKIVKDTKEFLSGHPRKSLDELAEDKRNVIIPDVRCQSWLVNLSKFYAEMLRLKRKAEAKIGILATGLNTYICTQPIDGCETACVGGGELMFYMPFVLSLKSDEVAFVYGHELYHTYQNIPERMIAHIYRTRKGELLPRAGNGTISYREPTADSIMKWYRNHHMLINMAADYEDNYILQRVKLVDEDFLTGGDKANPRFCYREEYGKIPFEKIYDEIEKQKAINRTTEKKFKPKKKDISDGPTILEDPHDGPTQPLPPNGTDVPDKDNPLSDIDNDKNGANGEGKDQNQEGQESKEGGKSGKDGDQNQEGMSSKEGGEPGKDGDKGQEGMSSKEGGEPGKDGDNGQEGMPGKDDGMSGKEGGIPGKDGDKDQEGIPGKEGGMPSEEGSEPGKDGDKDQEGIPGKEGGEPGKEGEPGSDINDAGGAGGDTSNNRADADAGGDSSGKAGSDNDMESARNLAKAIDEWTRRRTGVTDWNGGYFSGTITGSMSSQQIERVMRRISKVINTSATSKIVGVIAKACDTIVTGTSKNGHWGAKGHLWKKEVRPYNKESKTDAHINLIYMFDNSGSMGAPLICSLIDCLTAVWREYEEVVEKVVLIPMRSGFSKSDRANTDVIIVRNINKMSSAKMAISMVAGSDDMESFGTACAILRDPKIIDPSEYNVFLNMGDRAWADKNSVDNVCSIISNYCKQSGFDIHDMFVSVLTQLHTSRSTVHSALDSIFDKWKVNTIPMGFEDIS